MRQPSLLLLIDPALVVERAADFIGLHQDDARERHLPDCRSGSDGAGGWVGCTMRDPHEQVIQT